MASKNITFDLLFETDAEKYVREELQKINNEKNQKQNDKNVILIQKNTLYQILKGITNLIAQDCSFNAIPDIIFDRIVKCSKRRSDG